MQNTRDARPLADALQNDFTALPDRIRGVPELCHAEFRSRAEHTAGPEAEGFRVIRNAAGIPTAVVGEAGQGAPVTAIPGEPLYPDPEPPVKMSA